MPEIHIESSEKLTEVLLGQTRAFLWLKAAILERQYFDYYQGNGHPPPGFDGGPEPFIRLALATLLGSAGYPNPEGDDPEGHGPKGPVMRDLLIGLATVQLVTQMRTSAQTRTLQTAAADMVIHSAQQLKDAVR
jgi:hypothetical protein